MLNAAYLGVSTMNLDHPFLNMLILFGLVIVVLLWLPVITHFRPVRYVETKWSREKSRIEGFSFRRWLHELLKNRVWRGIFLVGSVILAVKPIAMSVESLVEGFERGSYWWVVGIVSGYAWFAYLVMGLFWVLDKRLGYWFPMSGFVAGITCILPFLVVAILGGPIGLFVAALGLGLVSLQVLLATEMVYFHIGKNTC